MLLPLKPLDQIDYKGNLDFLIVIRNRKIVEKLGLYCWYFCLNWKYQRAHTENTSKQWKIRVFGLDCQWKRPWDCFINFLLIWLMCQQFVDRKKCVSCARVSWITKIYQSKAAKKAGLTRISPKLHHRSSKRCRSCTEKGSITSQW